MYNKFNTKTLIIIIIVLAAIIAATAVIDSMKGERSFKDKIVTIDSAAINNIVIKPSKSNQETILTKNQSWKVDVNGKLFPADEDEIGRMLHQLIELKPIRLAGSNAQAWEKYELTDSLATRVILKKGSKVLTDLMIGKFTYQQASRKMTTYVRLSDEDKVYAVEGFLAMTFNRGSDGFRSSALLNGTPDQWTKLSFNYAQGKSIVLSKENNKWLLNDLPADSAKVAQYLNSLRYTKGTSFIDTIDVTQLVMPDCRVNIEGNNISPFEMAFYSYKGLSIVNSSVNPQSYFNGEPLHDKFFITEDKLK